LGFDDTFGVGRDGIGAVADGSSSTGGGPGSGSTGGGPGSESSGGGPGSGSPPPSCPTAGDVAGVTPSPHPDRNKSPGTIPNHRTLRKPSLAPHMTDSHTGGANRGEQIEPCPPTHSAYQGPRVQETTGTGHPTRDPGPRDSRSPMRKSGILSPCARPSPIVSSSLLPCSPSPAWLVRLPPTTPPIVPPQHRNPPRPTGPSNGRSGPHRRTSGS